jgi:hypothetical protein
MSSKIIGAGDDNTLVFDTGVPYVNARFYADGLWLNPTLYTYAGTVLTFLPAAFPASPTPGAPPRDTVVAVDGDTASVSTSSVTVSRNYTANELIASVQQRAFISLERSATSPLHPDPAALQRGDRRVPGARSLPSAGWNSGWSRWMCPSGRGRRGDSLRRHGREAARASPISDRRDPSSSSIRPICRSRWALR